MSNEKLTFQDFWRHYVKAHSHPGNRKLHFIGTGLTLVFLITAITNRQPLWLLAMPVVGYSFAWIGHFGLQKNKPATFGYPIRSLICDYYMFFLMLMGRMEEEVRRILNP